MVVPALLPVVGGEGPGRGAPLGPLRGQDPVHRLRRPHPGRQGQQHAGREHRVQERARVAGQQPRRLAGVASGWCRSNRRRPAPRRCAGRRQRRRSAGTAPRSSSRRSVGERARGSEGGVALLRAPPRRRWSRSSRRDQPGPAVGPPGTRSADRPRALRAVARPPRTRRGSRPAGAGGPPPQIQALGQEAVPARGVDQIAARMLHPPTPSGSSEAHGRRAVDGEGHLPGAPDPCARGPGAAAWSSRILSKRSRRTSKVVSSATPRRPRSRR